MVRTNFSLEGLVEDAEPPELVDFGGPEVEAPPETLRCSICGAPHSAVDLPAQYANPVCKECDELAVNETGDVPWHGWPPGEEPDTEPGVIASPPDHGENPVFIAGVKCWRRYRFGGWITRRDAFDCDSLEEFRDRHRHEGNVIYAFNTPQPDGVELPQGRCRQAIERREQLETLRDDAERLVEGDHEAGTVADLADRVAAANLTLREQAPDSPAADVTEYALAVVLAADDVLAQERDFTGLCTRYYQDLDG